MVKTLARNEIQEKDQWYVINLRNPESYLNEILNTLGCLLFHIGYNSLLNFIMIPQLPNDKKVKNPDVHIFICP